MLVRPLFSDDPPARSRSRLAALICATMCATLLVAPAGPAAADPVPPPPADEPSNAISEAQRLGVPVEILSARTETTRVFADPDGSQRLLVSARPERVLKGSEWADVQPDLVRQAGVLAPLASTVGVTFSGGGDGPLVRVVQEGVTFTLGWPGPLPVPTVAGSVATYPEVFPGVDLRMSADVDGYSQVLVVKTPSGAGRPELAELRVPFEVTG